MKNISFDNPYLLLVLIPLLAGIIVPVAIAIRKENRSKSITASFIMHLAIALCIALALAGMIYTSVMTETQVYVVADVSYSADKNLDQIDEYIQQIQKKLPRNSKLGVIVFGKDYKVLTDMGEDVVSVKDHGFTTEQTAATDITSALNYAATLFDEDVIKRIVLISDGKQTRTGAEGELVSAVENIYANDIYIDAIFLDDNLPADAKEVQISDVQAPASTYKDHKSHANILIQSSYDTDNAILTFFVNGVAQKKQQISLDAGFNTVRFELPTGSSGRFEYRFTLSAGADGTINNNTYEFTQTVAEKLSVLLVTGVAEDEAKIRAMYGEDAQIDVYVQKKDRMLTVPCTVEELCKYDEIVLSSFDVRKLNNVTSFLDSVHKVVSQFGKSLVTLGDLRIQNKTDNALTQLEDMLPVKFGNNDQDPKLYCIVLDTSRSMQNFSRLNIARQVVSHLLNMLQDDDYVMVIHFWGDYGLVTATPQPASNRDDIMEAVYNIDPKQGTMITEALAATEKWINDYSHYSDKQIMLISDGKSFINTDSQSDDPVSIVGRLNDLGVRTSVIHPAGDPEQLDDPGMEPNGNPKLLMDIANAGGGKYFSIRAEHDILRVVFEDIADNLTESVIEKQTPVKIARPADSVLNGILSLPDVNGYAYGKAKASATTVLTVQYEKTSKTVVDAPLYAYWNYGNGQVSSFTSSLSGDWAAMWDTDSSNQFFKNVTIDNTPEERIDYPYVLNVEYDGTYSQVELIPMTLNPNATVDVTITLPGGEKVTQQLIFDSERYFHRFETPLTGTYIVDVVYHYTDEKDFVSQANFSISYSPEYNMFEVFDAGALHAAIRNRGTVSEGKIPSLENNDKEVATYTVYFVAPLMILAAALYVIDIIVRKLKISDIKSFFGIKPKKGGSK